MDSPVIAVPEEILGFAQVVEVTMQGDELMVVEVNLQDELVLVEVVMVDYLVCWMMEVLVN